MSAASTSLLNSASHLSKEKMKTSRDGAPRRVSFLQKRELYPGLDAVIERAQNLARSGRGSAFVRKAALEITANIAKDKRTGHPDRRNRANIANAVYNWMKANIQYVRDPFHIEWLQAPEVTLQLKSGDCDDMSILATSLLGSMGIPVRLMVISQDAKTKQFGHIYAEYQEQNGNWIPFDVVIAGKVGDKPQQIVASKTVLLDDVLFQPLDQKNMGQPTTVASGFLADCGCQNGVQLEDLSGIGSRLKGAFNKVKDNADKIANVGINLAAGNPIGAGQALLAKKDSGGGGSAPAQQTPPTPEPEKSNTMLYVGGAAALLVVGFGVYFIAKK